MTWNLKSAPNQPGKIAIVTGANIGLGFETALALAEKGCEIVMACRDLKKAELAKSKILKQNSSAIIHCIALDLGDFASIRKFAITFHSKFNQLDFLINNAGLMTPPYQKTKDGFESQFGINYLGHFLLTGLLLDVIKKTPEARVVMLSSLAHKWGDIYFDDLNFENGYDKNKAYGQSKLACLMFAYELQRRFQKHGISAKSLAAHPGVSTTNLGRHMSFVKLLLAVLIAPFLFQPPKKGALPTLRAALDPTAKGGDYFGPDGKREMRGNPIKVDSNKIAKDQEKAKRLWEVSEKLVDCAFGF